ncbi:chaperonin 10-like protein [Halteromyces radiatus]|uniref:chaperonin 10-like protein n=1 Tax=Halteromyces radiatus TaxID=101107 RepID=UPI00221EA32B|nr:chaperonin 10-like protein [Halteromyces radiatus]KAI8081327.1 chaperonin 10-like protein [Halteromyces radiatus]
MTDSTTTIPTTMNALVLEKFGPPEELKYKSVPVPSLKKDTDLLVRVVCAGVNPIDAKLRQGNLFSFLVKKNAILGADYSGVVVKKGAKVTKFEVGDRVFGKLALPSGPQGAYSEYIVVTANDTAIAKKPENLSFVDAAAVGIAALTALDGVVNKRPLPLEHNMDPPPKVLVIGASGGVGMYGVQIAKAIGAHVVGICSGKNIELVKGFGADRVVDYNDQAAMDALVQEKNTFDVVFDLVGGDDYYKKMLPLVKEKTGMFSTAVGPTEHSGSTKVSLLGYASMGSKILYRGLFGSRRYSMILDLPHDQFASVLTPLLEKKLIKPYVPEENIFDLKDASKAHEKIESHRVVGKIVLRVSPDV